MKTILAAPDLLKVEKISFCSNEVQLVVRARLLKSSCPSCGWQSDKAHSRYRRHLADLPWEGVAVKLILSARKFFCLNQDCRQRIFCERLPGLDVAVATHKNIDLVFHTQVFKLKRDMQKRSRDSASSSALRQNPVAEGIDETPAHSSTTVCGGPSPSRTSAAGDQDHSRTPGGKKCK